MTSQLDRALRNLESAAALVDCAEEVVAQLHRPQETLSKTLWVRMDDGRLEGFSAWRCRFNDRLGPTKGGLRFHPDVSMDEVETLAFWMTIKCACAGLPFGGAKGGVRVDTKALSIAEIERLSRIFARDFGHFIGPDRDIPAPDMYADERVMAWIANEYGSIRHRHTPGVVTGKPPAIGGLEGRDIATARGACAVLSALVEDGGLDPGDRRVAIQGFGNAGAGIARLLAAAGYRIVAVSDSSRAIHCEEGLDLDAVSKAKAKNGTVGADGAEEIGLEELVLQDCDVLVPAATEDQITGDNAGDVQARIVLELANGPTSCEGDAILEDRGVTVIPDVLANAGGVTMSYFEWLQNRDGRAWTRDDAVDELDGRMERQARAVADFSAKHGTSLRVAAYATALKRIGAAFAAQGTQALFVDG